MKISLNTIDGAKQLARFCQSVIDLASMVEDVDKFNRQADEAEQRIATALQTETALVEQIALLQKDISSYKNDLTTEQVTAKERIATIKAEAQGILADADSRAVKLVADAQLKAAQIVADAQTSIEDKTATIVQLNTQITELNAGIQDRQAQLDSLQATIANTKASLSKLLEA